MTRALLLAAVLVLARGVGAQVAFESSTLPIVLIETDRAIPDEPKVSGTMRVIDNEDGRNAVTDPPTGYDGHIGIERRGASSQSFPKKQYALETREATGENRNVPLLGMPAENDWVLHAPYSDKSLVRNVLAFHMARATGRYASRTRLCEVVLNGEYQGVYVLLESIKRDRSRVDVARLRPDETTGDELTGGYIVQTDRPNAAGWFSAYAPTSPTPRNPFYAHVEPEGDEIVPEQGTYVRASLAALEGAMASGDIADPATGYPAYIDVGSFVDFVLVNEAARNVDGYRLSTYLHKDKDSNDPLWHAGPVWDFNLGFGNADYLGASATAGLQVETSTFGHPQGIPFWWRELVRDPAFSDSMRVRWRELRRGPFHTDSLTAFVAETAAQLEEAQARNFQRWPVLGRYVWPNAFVGDTHEDEVDYLTDWLTARLAWMDDELAVASEPPAATRAAVSVFPNPARGPVSVEVSLDAPERVTTEVLDARGRTIAVLHRGLVIGTARWAWEPGAAASGVYLVRVEGETFRSVQRVALAR